MSVDRKSKGKLSLFHSNGEQVITIYTTSCAGKHGELPNSVRRPAMVHCLSEPEGIQSE